MVASPSIVMASEPMTWMPMAPTAQTRRPSCRWEVTSAEKVEKMVSPPRKPVMISSFHIHP